MVPLKNYGWVPEWPKGADCKSVSNAFGGSNPPPSICQMAYADVAQLAEQLICNQQVIGSSPIIGLLIYISGPFETKLYGPLAQLVRAIGS